MFKTPANFGDAAFEDAVCDGGFAPKRLEKLLFRDKPSAVLKQIGKHAERLRPEVNFFRAVPEPLLGRVEAKRAKKNPVAAPRACPCCRTPREAWV